MHSNGTYLAYSYRGAAMVKTRRHMEPAEMPLADIAPGSNCARTWSSTLGTEQWKNLPTIIEFAMMNGTDDWREMISSSGSEGHFKSIEPGICAWKDVMPGCSLWAVRCVKRGGIGTDCCWVGAFLRQCCLIQVLLPWYSHRLTTKNRRAYI